MIRHGSDEALRGDDGNLEALRGDDGNLMETFLPIDRVAVPEVLLSDDAESLYVADDEAYWYEAGEPVTISVRTLSEFIRLADEPSTRVHHFANRYGLLGLCEKHALPYAHDRSPLRSINLSSTVSLALDYRCTSAVEERIEDWRYYSRRFRKILEIRQCIWIGETVAAAEWKEIGVSVWSLNRSATIDKQKRFLAHAVNTLFLACGIHPVITWDAEPFIGFGSRDRMTLFAALTMQLAMTIADCKIAVCSECHSTYTPGRRAHRGEANYCPRAKCQRASVRNRVQRHRDRQRDASAATDVENSRSSRESRTDRMSEKRTRRK